MVFQDPRALADLNAIGHRYVGQAVAQQVAEAEADGVPVVGIDAIGLLESSLVNHCHRTVAVTAPEELRVKRIMARRDLRGVCPPAGGGPEAQRLVPGTLR